MLQLWGIKKLDYETDYSDCVHPLEVVLSENIRESFQFLWRCHVKREIFNDSRKDSHDQ